MTAIDGALDLERILKCLLHGFARTRGAPQSVEVASHTSDDYYRHVFHDSCTKLTLQFLHGVVPFLASKGVSHARLPNGKVVGLANIRTFRGNYVDSSVPMFGRISHDVLEVEGAFIDISGSQFRPANQPTICWFESAEELHSSFQGRPLQSFREIGVVDMTLTRPQFDSEVKREMQKLFGGETALKACCDWCYGVGSKKCIRCNSVRYCGPTCQKYHWKHEHKAKCTTGTQE